MIISAESVNALLCVCAQTPAAVGRRVRGVYARDGGVSGQQEEGDLGDHPRWKGRSDERETFIRNIKDVVSHSCRGDSSALPPSVCSVCLRSRVSPRVPRCSSPCDGPATPLNSPPHPWPNLWPPATLRPTRTRGRAP